MCCANYAVYSGNEIEVEILFYLLAPSRTKLAQLHMLMTHFLEIFMKVVSIIDEATN